MHCYWTRFSAERASSYHIFFQTAIAGGFLVVGAYVLLGLLESVLAPPYEWRPSHTSFVFSNTAAVTVILGLMLPPLFNCFYGRQQAARRAAGENGDFTELLTGGVHRTASGGRAVVAERQVLYRPSAK